MTHMTTHGVMSSAGMTQMWQFEDHANSRSAGTMSNSAVLPELQLKLRCRPAASLVKVLAAKPLWQSEKHCEFCKAHLQAQCPGLLCCESCGLRSRAD